MATQSLYRRYRPRRFGELRGQPHVVKALRDSVAAGREGQAYLFSGPRGTGKTTTARIMAKALNCPNVVDGEPCSECESCLAIENGTSYDVHELDAASNNGVDAIRDLIEKASLGTPGRHKVYILDEVHMLSRGAEAALLKTLEEPPPHVVFVLATTDPQKMSDTIRSRTQHLQFHLLPSDELDEHLRWVVADAGLDVDEAAIEAALERGGGSARDTLSALELLASTGGQIGEATDVDGLLQALVDDDPGSALQTIAAGVAQGLDPRAMTEDLIRHLRNGFLSLMAPELVVMAPDRLESLAATAQQYGAARLVRAIERLGSTLTDMRQAPDPRVLVEVALVQLTSDDAGGDDLGALQQRLGRLEQQIGSIGTVATNADAAATSSPQERPTPRDPQTGRKVLGGAAQRAREAANAAADRSTTNAPSPNPATTSAATPDPAEAKAADREPVPPAANQERPAVASQPADSRPADPPSAAQPSADPAPVDDAVSAEVAAATPDPPAETVSPTPRRSIPDAWDEVRPQLKPLVRALFSAGEMIEVAPATARFVVTTDAQVDKCAEHRDAVSAALSASTGTDVTVEITTDARAGASNTSAGGDAQSSPRPAATVTTQPSAESANDSGPARERRSEPDQAVAAAPSPSADAPPAEPDFEPESDIDLDALVDAPPDSYKSPLDKLADAFPGSEMLEEDR